MAGYNFSVSRLTNCIRDYYSAPKSLTFTIHCVKLAGEETTVFKCQQLCFLSLYESGLPVLLDDISSSQGSILVTGKLGTRCKSLYHRNFTKFKLLQFLT